ncbi:MAG: adenosylcobinamide-GDP ribazoletransferase, partial [Candidatus Jordarchaeaceae archaeon]
KSLISFFTIIPIRVDPLSEDTQKYLPLTPVIGAFYGIIAGLLFIGLNSLLPPFPSAAIMLLTVYLLNGFLHIDGLIDFGDGITAFGEREKKLSAMKDPRVGAGGVALVLLVTLTALSLYSALPYYHTVSYTQLFIFIYTLEILCKNSLLACATFGKPHNSGIGKIFVEKMGKKKLLTSTLMSLILILIIIFPYTCFLRLSISLEIKIFLLLSPAISIPIGAAIAYFANKIFGCVTGDVLGASHEISRLIILVVIIVVIKLYA